MGQLTNAKADFLSTEAKNGHQMKKLFRQQHSKTQFFSSFALASYLVYSFMKQMSKVLFFIQFLKLLSTAVFHLNFVTLTETSSTGNFSRVSTACDALQETSSTLWSMFLSKQDTFNQFSTNVYSISSAVIISLFLFSGLTTCTILQQMINSLLTSNSFSNTLSRSQLTTTLITFSACKHNPTATALKQCSCHQSSTN